MYLTIQTHCGDDKYTHFIHLTKKDVLVDVTYLFQHQRWFGIQVVDKVYLSKTRLSNW